jgi:hypothetical protein
MAKILLNSQAVAILAFIPQAYKQVDGARRGTVNALEVADTFI